MTDLRAAAALITRYRCGGEAGRRVTDPVYQDTVENRHQMGSTWPYSSCADLGHALDEDLGFRGRWLNRESLGQYTVADNVSDLWDPSLDGPARVCRPGERFGPGDILIVDFYAPSKTHVLVVLSDDGEWIESGDYGQAPMRQTQSWMIGCRVRRRKRHGDALEFSPYGDVRDIDRVASLDEMTPDVAIDAGVLAAARAWAGGVADTEPPPELDTDPSPPPAHVSDAAPLLRRGMRGPDVTRLQRALLAVGASLPRYGADGDFGVETEDGLRAWQTARGVPESRGVCDRVTWELLAGTGQ